MIGLEIHLHIDARVIALKLLKGSGNYGAGKTWLLRGEGKSLGIGYGGRWLFGSRRRSANLFLATSDHNHMRGNRYAYGRSEAVDAISRDRKPQSRIEKIARIRSDIGQFYPLNRAVVRALQSPLVFEIEGGARILCEIAGQFESHRRILCVSFWVERLIVNIRELRDTQTIIELKRDRADIVERSDSYRGPGGQLMSL